MTHTINKSIPILRIVSIPAHNTTRHPTDHCRSLQRRCRSYGDQRGVHPWHLLGNLYGLRRVTMLISRRRILMRAGVWACPMTSRITASVIDHSWNRH